MSVFGKISASQQFAFKSGHSIPLKLRKVFYSTKFLNLEPFIEKAHTKKVLGKLTLRLKKKGGKNMKENKGKSLPYLDIYIIWKGQKFFFGGGQQKS